MPENKTIEAVDNINFQDKLTRQETYDTADRRDFVSSTIEMATGQHTQPRAVAGVPRRAAWQPKSPLRNCVSAAPRTIIFYSFFLQLVLVIFHC